MDSINVDGESWVTKITVDYEGYSVTGSVSGYLQYTLLHPCLVNVGQVTFTSQRVEYDVCQNETATGAEFTFTDTISELTSTPNFCGNPVISAVFVEDYDSGVTDFMGLHSFIEDNTGYISFDARMCQRDFAREDPYQLQIQLSYSNGSVTTLIEDKVDIQLRDPCEYTNLPGQKFFLSTYYSLQTYGEPLFFDLSANYVPDNVTDWSGLNYFCGYPTFKVLVYNESNIVVFDSSADNNLSNFTNLVNAVSEPPISTTSLILNSTDNNDYRSQYIVEVEVTVLSNSVSDYVGIKVNDACLSTKIVDTINVSSMSYVLGSKRISQQFTTGLDTISALFLQDKNIAKECGEQIVACQVVTTKTTFFFTFIADARNNSNYNISVFTNSSTDVGLWQVKCTVSLYSYPLVTPLNKYFKINITSSVQEVVTNGACIGSSDVKSCQMFLDSNPPYLSAYPDS